MVLGEIFSPDILIVLVVIALLFGGAKLPKLARSLGSAKGEFERGLREGATTDTAAAPTSSDDTPPAS
jgi:sec-independent protein translocase protein TatA